MALIQKNCLSQSSLRHGSPQKLASHRDSLWHGPPLTRNSSHIEKLPFAETACSLAPSQKFASHKPACSMAISVRNYVSRSQLDLRRRSPPEMLPLAAYCTTLHQKTCFSWHQPAAWLSRKIPHKEPACGTSAPKALHIIDKNRFRASRRNVIHVMCHPWLLSAGADNLCNAKNKEGSILTS